MILTAEITGYLDSLVTISGGYPVKVMPIDLYNPEEGTRRTLFAEVGRYEDDNYIPYSDIQMIESVERELNRAGYDIIASSNAPIFSSLTREQSTIATKKFNVIEREENEHP